MKRGNIILFVVLAWSQLPSVVAASGLPRRLCGFIFANLSRYEQMHVGRVLQAQRLRLAVDPEGQLVTFIQFIVIQFCRLCEVLEQGSCLDPGKSHQG